MSQFVRSIPVHARYVFTVAMMAVGVTLLPIAVSAAVPDDRTDYSIPGGHFYSQTGGGKGGYGVRDLAGVKFWSEYDRLGGPEFLGYPISKPFWGPGGYLYQGFERGLMQWRPEVGHVMLANNIEIIEWHDKAHDAWLFNEFSIPFPRQPKPGTFEEEAEERLSWLTNDDIRSAFLTNPATGQEWDLADAMNYFGLPQSEPRRAGPFIVQRFQRIPLQLWIDDVPGMPPAGSVVPLLSGHLVKECGALPYDATVPEPAIPARGEFDIPGLDILGFYGF